EAKVIPNCVAAKYESKCVTILFAVLAKPLFKSVRTSIWDARTFTIANSAATKNPLSNTKNAVKSNMGMETESEEIKGSAIKKILSKGSASIFKNLNCSRSYSKTSFTHLQK